MMRLIYVRCLLPAKWDDHASGNTRMLVGASRHSYDYTTLSITYWHCGTPTKIITVDASVVLVASSLSKN